MVRLDGREALNSIEGRAKRLDHRHARLAGYAGPRSDPADARARRPRRKKLCSLQPRRSTQSNDLTTQSLERARHQTSTPDVSSALQRLASAHARGSDCSGSVRLASIDLRARSASADSGWQTDDEGLQG